MRDAGHGKLAEIEGLRALAVALVLLYHLGFVGMSGGYIGVDVFFVVSGFLITGLLLREVERTGTISLRHFWARRMRRIVPMAVVVVVATAVVGIALFERNRGRQLLEVGLGGVGFSANLVLDAQTGDYLAGVVNPSPLQHYWSLGVEEQFYVVWPLLAVLVVRLARRWWRLGLVVVAVAAIGLSLWASIHHVRPGVPSGYYLPHTRAWEIMLGAVLAMFAASVRRIPPAARAVVGWLGMLAILVAALRFDAETPFPGTAALLPVLGTVAVIVAGDSARGPHRLLRMETLQYVGGISFALYLWHWPLIVFAEHQFGTLHLGGRLVVVVLALGLAEASRVFVEEPLRWSTWLSFRPSRSIVAGLATVALFVGTGAVLLQRLPAEAVGLASFAPLDDVDDDRPTSVVGALPPPTEQSTTVPPSTVPPEPRDVNAYLLGDSTMAVMRWYEQGQVSLQGFEYVMDAEGCRRLYYTSCESREFRIPQVAAKVIPTIDVAQYDVIVVMVGYHSRPESIEKELLEVGAALQSTGRPVIFVNFKESLTFPAAGSQGTRSVYSDFNDTLDRLTAAGLMGDTTIADWNRFSYQHPEWFRPDGIHTTIVGAVALGWFLSMTIAAEFGNPCPFDGVYPCAVPEMDDGSTDYLATFGVEYTDIHCYEDGPERRPNCRIDRRITATDL